MERDPWGALSKIDRDSCRLADLCPLEARITRASRQGRNYRFRARKALREGGEGAAEKVEHFARQAILWDLELAEAQQEAAWEGLRVKRGYEIRVRHNWRALDPIPKFKPPIPGGEIYLELLRSAAA